MSEINVSRIKKLPGDIVIEAATVTVSGDFYSELTTEMQDWNDLNALNTFFLAVGAEYTRDLHLKRNESISTTINISAGYILVTDLSGSSNKILNYDFTPEYTLDCTTTGENGLDTGSLAPSTWYYFYLIGDEASNTVASTASTSSVKPALPGTYNRYLQIGAMKTDGSSQFYDFYQIDKTVSYVTVHKELDRGHATSEEAVTLNYVPPNITKKWIGQAYSEWSSGGGSFSIRTKSGSTLYKVSGESVWINYVPLSIPLSQSQKLFYLKDSGSTLGLTLETTGFELQVSPGSL